MEALKIGDVIRRDSLECVIENVEYHPGYNYQGQGDRGCESSVPTYWIVFARILNPDGSYDGNRELVRFKLACSDDDASVPFNQPSVLRKMQLSFV